MKRRYFATVALVVCMATEVMAQSSGKLPHRRHQVELLHEQLISVEASLETIDQRLDRSSHGQRSAEYKVEQSESANRLLKRERDRYWDAAQQQYEKAPPVARDPFGANEDAINQAQDRINKMRADKSALQAERVNLETEQRELWARIAAAFISEREISDRQEYNLAPGIDPADAESKETAADRAQAAEALVKYLRTIDAAANDFSKAVRSNPNGAYQALLANCEAARKQLVEELRALPANVSDRVENLRRYARDLEEKADNLSDFNRKTLDGDQGGNDSRKTTLRKQLREEGFAFASLVLDLDDGILELFEEWKVRPNRDKPLKKIEIKLADRTAQKKSASRQGTVGETEQSPVTKATSGKPGKTRRPVQDSQIDKIFPLNSKWSATTYLNGRPFVPGNGTISNIQGSVATMNYFNEYGEWELSLTIRKKKVVVSNVRGLTKGGNADNAKFENFKVSGELSDSGVPQTFSLSGTWTVSERKNKWDPRSEKVRFVFDRE